MYDLESLEVLNLYCDGLGTQIKDFFSIKPLLETIIVKLNNNEKLSFEDREILQGILDDLIPKKLELAINIILGEADDIRRSI